LSGTVAVIAVEGAGIAGTSCYQSDSERPRENHNQFSPLGLTLPDA
jgi:hypothetical protein